MNYIDQIILSTVFVLLFPFISNGMQMETIFENSDTDIELFQQLRAAFGPAELKVKKPRKQFPDHNILAIEGDKVLLEDKSQKRKLSIVNFEGEPQSSVDQEWGKAFFYFKKALRADELVVSAEACFEAGCQYGEGRGVEKNKKKARKYLLRAAAQTGEKHIQSKAVRMLSHFGLEETKKKN